MFCRLRLVPLQALKLSTSLFEEERVICTFYAALFEKLCCALPLHKNKMFRLISMHTRKLAAAEN